MDISLLINIMLYGVIAVMIVNIIITSKSQKKRKGLIELVNTIKDQDLFFEKADAIIEANQDDAEILNKARVLTLWGIAYHKKYERFDEALNAIELDKLIAVKKGAASIDMNEDSFFYMYLGIPNFLYADQKMDLYQKMEEKMQSLDEELKGQLVREIAKETDKYYKNTDDRGLTFYEKVLDGNYGEYTYSKTMIGLYKSIVNANAARIYLDRGDTEKYQTTVEMLRDFDQSGVGHRWLASLDLKVENEQPEDEEGPSSDENNETFQITEDSAKQADVMDAEVVKEEENKEQEHEEKKEDHE
jgi:hypothetical protein